MRESEGKGEPAPGQSVWVGRLLIAVAAVLWSTSGFFAKAPWFDAWPPDGRGLMLAFWRSFFACVILMPLIRRPKWQWQIAPMVFCFTIMVWSFMSAMVYGPAANAIWLQYLSPAWVLVAGVCLLNERVTRADLQMIAFCLSGVLLILVMELWKGGSLFATTMGILSGVGFAGVVVSLRGMRDADPAWLITLNHSATALLLAPWVIRYEFFQSGPSINYGGYVALGLFGIFQMSVPYILFARGLKTTSSPEASVLALIEPILVPIWVYIAWHHHASYQPPNWWTWVGGGLILFGLVGRYMPQMLREWNRRRTRLRAAERSSEV